MPFLTNQPTCQCLWRSKTNGNGTKFGNEMLGILVVIQLFYIVVLKFVYCYTWLLFNYLSGVGISEKFNSDLSTYRGVSKTYYIMCLNILK